MVQTLFGVNIVIAKKGRGRGADAKRRVRRVNYKQASSLLLFLRHSVAVIKVGVLVQQPRSMFKKLWLV